MTRKIELPSIRDSVYAQIREMILDGEWPPGERIDLNFMAKEFGVSKTPLNEAMQKLIREGLLTVKPRSGTFVSSLDIDEMFDTFDYRLMLEKGAAEVILDNLTPPTLRSIETLHNKMASVLVDADSLKRYRQFLCLDNEFHKKIISLSANSLLIDNYDQATAKLLLMRMVGSFRRKDYEATITDHRRILDALRSGDWIAFAQASQVHIKNAKTKVQRTHVARSIR